MYFQPSYGKARYQLPGGSNSTTTTVCRQPGVVYWPDVDPCNRPKSALFQNNAMWAKYQRTGYLPPILKPGDGYYHPPATAEGGAGTNNTPADGDKEEVNLEVETEPSFWDNYGKYAVAAVGVSLGFYVGYLAFRKK